MDVANFAYGVSLLCDWSRKLNPPSSQSDAKLKNQSQHGHWQFLSLKAVCLFVL